MEYVIGVDIGTQSTKALLVDRQGAIVAQHASSYQPDTPKPLWAEQWPAVWFKAVTECIAACVQKGKQAGVAADSIKAVCVSSLYGGSGIPVDSEMRPLHPCLIWMDRRATDQVEWVRGNIDLEQLYAITGNGVDSYYGYTKMLWLRDHAPEVWAQTRYFLPPNAYVIYMLTGEIETAIIFALPTVGPAIVGSMAIGDVYVTATFMLVLSATLIVGNIIADMLLAMLDPRVRQYGGA